MELWQTVLTAIVGNTLAVAALAWLCKTLITNSLQRDSKRFETELKAKTDAETEKLRAALKAEADRAIEKVRNEHALRTIEHQVKWTSLQEKRAQVVAELNGLIAVSIWAAQAFINPFVQGEQLPSEDRQKAAMSALKEVLEFFGKNRIYLPAWLCAGVEELLILISKHIQQYSFFTGFPDDPSGAVQQSRNESLFEGIQVFSTKAPAIQMDLEAKFRQLLGPDMDIDS